MSTGAFFEIDACGQVILSQPRPPTLIGVCMTSPPLSKFRFDQRCWLFLLSAALAIVLSFFAIPDNVALSLVSKWGFWFVLATFVIWLGAIWQTFAPNLKRFQWNSVDRASLLIVLAGGIVLLSHETFGFKIVMDEIMLLGTSMSMHFQKTVLTPLRGNDIYGVFLVLDGILDKRPLFFPFLVSLLHDLTGYRPGNALALNAILTFVFLWLVFETGRRIAGRIAGWLGVILFAGLPLLAHNSTGGGFELLNLVMILATLLLGARFAEKRDGASLTAFCYSGLLLAQVRYESVVFLLPMILLVLWVWFRDGRATLSWPLFAAPLLMIHYPLHHRIFDLRSTAWEMASKPGYAEPFSITYVPENLLHAMKFFFGAPTDQPNSMVLSVLGCLAIPFFVLLVVKRLRALDTESPIGISITLFSIGFALHFALMMCYFWGKFDDAVIRRLSLPTHLGMVVAILAILPQFPPPAVARTLLGIATFGMIVRSVPSMAAHAYSQEYLPGRETAWRRKFMAAQPRPDYLMIDNDSTLWVTHLVSATPTVGAVKRRDDIAYHMRNRTFSAVYVFQRYNIDPNTSELTIRKGDELSPDFVLETVAEERLQVLTLSRISRIKEIRSGSESISATAAVDAGSPADRAAIERGRRVFMETFLRKLP